MKKFVTRYLPFIILVIAFVLLIPGISKRIENENKNDNVVISILYNDLINKVSENKIDDFLAKCKEEGLNTISVMDDYINSLTLRGDITSIKYNALCQKYDNESIKMAEFIANNCPNISYDSHVIIASKDSVVNRLANQMPKRYDEDDFINLGVFGDKGIFVLYDGSKELWEYAIGYDEESIAKLHNEGFEVALVHKVKDYSEVAYLDDIEAIIKKYNVRYLNLKKDTRVYQEADSDRENFEGLSRIINENNMTLVLTENTDQLSNQKFLGYTYIFNDVIKNGGKVIRSYEAYDDVKVVEDFHTHRVDQYFNSVITRNTRFINITQIVNKNLSHDELLDYAFRAATESKEKIEKLGFRVNGEVNALDYIANRKLISALCAVIMVMCLLLIYEMLGGTKRFFMTIAAIIVALGAFLITFILPEGLVLLYPTVFCIIQSSVAITTVLYFIKRTANKISMLLLITGALAIMLSILLLGAVGLGAMLSGIDYYINNNIFRGIKLSLIVPVFYTTVVYYIMFVKDNKRSLLQDAKMVLDAQIKVYWVLIAVAVIGVGAYYIIRSGNVSSISTFENTMRNIMTELFTERPRTKEFLIGYPALVLFAYYAKKSDMQLVKWILAIAMSILAASITNSFCHVFTDFSVIVSRTINGLILGVIVSAVAYVINIVLLKLLNIIKDKYNEA